MLTSILIFQEKKITDFDYFRKLWWKITDYTMGRKIPLPAHNWVNVWLIIVSGVIFVITTAVNGLAGSGAGVPSIFYSTVGDISDKYQLFNTPAGFTFIIWSVIYLWLAVSLVIIITTIFINTEFGRLYLTPTIASPAVTATLSINFSLNLAWIFIWDRYDGRFLFLV